MKPRLPIPLLAIAAVLAACIVPLAAAAAPVPGYTLVDLGTLGGPGSHGSAISNSGLVVGCSDAMPSGVHAFVYDRGTMTDLGTGTADGQGNACALAVNDAGLVAGRAASGELVLWQDGKVTPLGVNGDVGGMNDQGAVAGSFDDAAGTHPFLYAEGKVHDLGGQGAARAVNDRGQVVGRSGGHAFLYAKGAMRDLGTVGGGYSLANDINERGEVVGFSTDPHAIPTPFIDDGTMRALPGGGYASAIGINNRGQVVASAEGRHGYLVESGHVYWLSDLPAVREKGWHHMEPTGINDRGWIVGSGFDTQGNMRAFVLVPYTKVGALPASR